MASRLEIVAVDPDDDYLGIEIYAANERFAGRTHVYAGLTDLSDFARVITAFPRDKEEQRRFEFGSRDPGIAGGYCGITFRCLDYAGHVGVEVTIEDDAGLYENAQASFGFRTEPGAIDRFVHALQTVEAARCGSAILGEA